MDRIGVPEGEAKKLEEAAAYWARGGKHGGPTAEDDLALFGVSRETARAWIGEETEEPEDCSVYPENWSAVTLFLALQTQWRIVQGMGGPTYTGLDYAAVWSVLRGMYEPKEWPPLFAGICIMEASAIPVLNNPAKEK